jgi:hypothetical protein
MNFNNGNFNGNINGNNVNKNNVEFNNQDIHDHINNNFYDDIYNCGNFSDFNMGVYRDNINDLNKYEVEKLYSFNNKLSIHIPCVNPSVIFNICGFDKYKNFNYIYDKIENEIVEIIISNFIMKQLKYQHIGVTTRVDLIKKYNNYGVLYYAAFCHFDYWYNNNITHQIQFNMSKNIQSMFYYEEKSYWLIARNVNPLDEEDVKLHRIIDEQQNIIMKCCGYNCGDFQYKYKDNVLINTFHFINPVNKCKKKLNSIINFQQNIINSILV